MPDRNPTSALLLILRFSNTYIPSITFIQYIHPSSPVADVPLHLLIAGQLIGKIHPGVPVIELGPALQQADALPSDCMRRTHVLRRTLSYVAPLIAESRRGIIKRNPCLSAVVQIGPTPPPPDSQVRQDS